jgi:hypothetical protein
VISSPAAQWLLSALFAVVIAYAVVHLGRSSSIRDKISYAIHTVMGLAMLAMVWPWGMVVPPIVQIVVFTAGALWFVSLLLFPGMGKPVDGAPGHHDGRAKTVYHGAMMAGMVAMAVGMAEIGGGQSFPSGTVTTTATGVGTRAAAATGSTAMPGMPGMAMSAGAVLPGGGVPVWANVLAIACAIAFGVASLAFAGITLATATSGTVTTAPGRLRIADAVWNLLMAGGMTILFLPLIQFSP